MASIRKSGDKWRAEVCARGVRKSRRFSTKGRARAWAEQTERDLLDGVIDHDKSLADAMDKYAIDVSPKHKGRRWEQIRLNALKRSTIASKRISLVTATHIAEWRDKRLREVSAASVRREMTLLASVFTTARKEWGWIAQSPMADVSKPPSPPHRYRRISADEQAMLESTLDPLMRVVFLLALETAMRLGEICSIRPDMVRGKYLALHTTKNKDRRHVPLSSRARALLKSVGNEIPIKSEYASRLFGRAVKKCGIADLRFHDTRHEAFTRLARKLDVLDLARMAGMRDTKTVMIYYNATADEIADRLG